jgi:hypothetical protein
MREGDDGLAEGQVRSVPRLLCLPGVQGTHATYSPGAGASRLPVTPVTGIFKWQRFGSFA